MINDILDDVDKSLQELHAISEKLEGGASSISGLLPDEEKVMDHLVQAFTIFQSLPVQRKHDLPDFVNALHILQKIVAHRQMRRLYPEYWISEKT